MKSFLIFYTALFFWMICLPSPNFIFADSFVNEHSQGWHWYQDPYWIKPTKGSKEALEKSGRKSMSMSNMNPTVQMEAIQSALKNALNKAVLHPTEKNVQYYIEVQNLVNENGSHFSDVWQTVLLKHPELNYSVDHPTNQLGKQVYLDLQNKDQAQAIADLSKHYGLFFFFRSSCPYCHKFAPIVQDFANRYGLSVVPVSLDGGGLPEFPNPRIDNGASTTFHVSVAPALFLVDPDTRKVLPISYGLITENEISSRIYEISKVLNQHRDPISSGTEFSGDSENSKELKEEQESEGYSS